MTEQTTGFAVIYRWRLHAGREEAFARAWETVTRRLRAARGGLGSRLHRDDEGLWTAYAQWPSRAAWERSLAAGPVDPEASAAMGAAIAESLEPLLLEPVRDLLAGP